MPSSVEQRRMLDRRVQVAARAIAAEGFEVTTSRICGRTGLGTGSVISSLARLRADGSLPPAREGAGGPATNTPAWRSAVLAACRSVLDGGEYPTLGRIRAAGGSGSNAALRHCRDDLIRAGELVVPDGVWPGSGGLKRRAVEPSPVAAPRQTVAAQHANACRVASQKPARPPRPPRYGNTADERLAARQRASEELVGAYVKAAPKLWKLFRNGVGSDGTDAR
jgi:hypothetical protein